MLPRYDDAKTLHSPCCYSVTHAELLLSRVFQVWDQRAKRSVITFQDKYQVTSVAFADAGDQVYSGGLDNCVKVRKRYGPIWPISCG